MDGSSHLSIAYQLKVESPIWELEGWSPTYGLRGLQYGELTISRMEVENDQVS